MTEEYQRKKTIILEFISKYYYLFLSQAKKKLIKYNNFKDPSNPRELLSDVLYSIIIKLEYEDSIDKFYEMLVNDKLKNFIFIALENNSKYATSPYLRQKIADKKRIPFNPEIEIEVEITYQGSLSELDKEILIKIDNIIDNPEEAKRLFGKNFKYYLTLIDIFRDQAPQELKKGKELLSCYAKIEREYFLRNVAYHYRKIWRILREELIKNKISHKI